MHHCTVLSWAADRQRRRPYDSAGQSTNLRAASAPNGLHCWSTNVDAAGNDAGCLGCDAEPNATRLVALVFVARLPVALGWYWKIYNGQLGEVLIHQLQSFSR